MKLTLLPIVAILMTGLSSCTKGVASKQSVLPAGVYRGVVVFNVCTHAVIQTIGSPNSIGQDTWTDGANTGGAVLHHVFSVQNGCQFSAGNYAQGDTISFRIIQPQAQTCISCLIAVATPDSTYAIQVQ